MPPASVFTRARTSGPSGTAGAVVTDDAELAARLRLLRNYGSAVKYHHETQGFNARLDALQAAMLRVKLARLDDWNHRRRGIAARYREGLSQSPSLVLPHVHEDVEPAWHLFVIRHPRRDDLQRYLSQTGIETLIHYPIPPHRSGAYADRAFRDGDFPITERTAATLLSLPMGPHRRVGSARLRYFSPDGICLKLIFTNTSRTRCDEGNHRWV